jgi:rubrerythrin
MKLDPKIVEAAAESPYRTRMGEMQSATVVDENGVSVSSQLRDDVAAAACRRLNATYRARRVLKAASECVPDEVVETACKRYHDAWEFYDELTKELQIKEFRKAFRDALAKWGEE